MVIKKPHHRAGLVQFVAGVFFGFILSSFISSISFLERGTPFDGIGVRSSIGVRSPGLFKEGNGWSLVHVFFGNTSHIADNSAISTSYFNSVEWFSQARQDEIVSALLRRKKHGYFVDLAANDATKISNTYALEKNFGWEGLCLEPNPMYWASLSYRKCHVVGAVIGDTNMEEVQFRFPNRAGPKGGIVGNQFDNKHESKFHEDHPRYTVTLLDVFERFGTPKVIDYLSLDVEGAEEFIMESFPFEEYRFNVLTVERPSAELSDILNANAYTFLKVLKKNSHETLWVHNSQLHSVDRHALDIDTETYVYHESDTSFYKNRDAPQPTD